MSSIKNVRLYLITDDTRSGGRPVEEVVEQALRGGAQCVQYRPHGISDAEFLEKAIKLRKITGRAGALLIINDRCDIALAAGADGVHLGAGDMPVGEAKRLLGRGGLAGFSAHSGREARQARAAGADYITLSPLFPTTKAGGREAMGLRRWKRAAGGVSIPVFALGGIGLGNIGEAARAGIGRVAVVSAVTEAEDIAAAAREIKEGVKVKKKCVARGA